MRLVVCLKHVPDSLGALRFHPEHLTVERGKMQGRMGVWDEYALEQALCWQDLDPDLEIIVLTMGPPDAVDSLKRALAKGASRAVLVSDKALVGSDVIASSLVLTEALRRIGGVDLVLIGMKSTDGGTALLGPALAERLRWPLIAQAFKLELNVPERNVMVERQLGDRLERCSASWPAVLTIGHLESAPRLPTFSGIMSLARKPVETWSLADLALTPDQVGKDAARLQLSALEPIPTRPVQVLLGSIPELSQQLRSFLMGQGGD